MQREDGCKGERVGDGHCGQNKQLGGGGGEAGNDKVNSQVVKQPFHRSN